MTHIRRKDSQRRGVVPDFNSLARNFTIPYDSRRDRRLLQRLGNKDAQPIIFSHGWPLNSDNWEVQMFFPANKGYRVVAHDRRGFGCSSLPWEGNNMDTYADDLQQLFEKLDLKNVMRVGHSTGGGEVVRFLGRHGTTRVSKAVLVAATTPLLLETESSPGGLPLEYYDAFLAVTVAGRSQLMLDVPAGPFYGFNRPNAKASQG